MHTILNNKHNDSYSVVYHSACERDKNKSKK